MMENNAEKRILPQAQQDTPSSSECDLGELPDLASELPTRDLSRSTVVPKQCIRQENDEKQV